MEGRRYYVKIIRFICGFLCSFSFSLLTRQYTMNSVWRNGCQVFQSYHRCRDLREETNAKELVLVAVMTHMGTIATRAVGINRTWGQEIPGKLLFFVGQSENTTEVNLPLIVLPVADDVYPPQRKAMLMLKYVYENYAERFRWFIRADDDVFIRGDNLIRLLRSINSSDDILLGHPGTGKKEEIGKLGLDDKSNFCIGGTGIILSQSVLKKVYPYLDHCSRKTATVHEDSEVGRCLRKFVGVQCPWGYEANEFFHQEYGDGSIAYHGELDSIVFEKAVSLHPVKDMRYIYRLHVYYLSIKERQNQNRARTLREHLKYTKQLLDIFEKIIFHKASTFHCHRDHCGEFHDEDSKHNKDDMPGTWTLFHNSRSYTSRLVSTPVHFLQGSNEKGLQQVVKKAKLVIRENARTELYHDLYFGKYNAGYSMEHPIHGNLYEVQYLVRVKRYVDGRLQSVRIPKRAKLRESFGSLLSRLKKRKTESELIDIVLPLSGPFKSFERFMKNLEGTLRKPHEIGRMLIVFFRQVSSLKPKFKSLFDSYKKKFPGTKFVWLEVDGVFDSSVALQTAMKYFSNENNLLFLTEIDVFFDLDFLQRCRHNTEAGKIYFPVSFGAYGDINFNKKSLIYRENSGRWNLDDFSIFCAYSNDVMVLKEMHAGNVSFEEAALVEQFVTCRSHVFEIFRAPDPGLFRSMTSPHCQGKQNTICHSSKEELFDYMFKKNYLIDYL